LSVKYRSQVYESNIYVDI